MFDPRPDEARFHNPDDILVFDGCVPSTEPMLSLSRSFETIWTFETIEDAPAELITRSECYRMAAGYNVESITAPAEGDASS